MLSSLLYDTADSGGTPGAKKRRLMFALPTISPKESWTSEFNLDDKVETSQKEVGDGASSRVYIGRLHGMTVAVKQLKCYSPRLASGLIKPMNVCFISDIITLSRCLGLARGWVVLLWNIVRNSFMDVH